MNVTRRAKTFYKPQYTPDFSSASCSGTLWFAKHDLLVLIRIYAITNINKPTSEANVLKTKKFQILKEDPTKTTNQNKTKTSKQFQI
jgi:hypothetical protein